jgi:hypothetical protein
MSEDRDFPAPPMPGTLEHAVWWARRMGQDVERARARWHAIERRWLGGGGEQFRSWEASVDAMLERMQTPEFSEAAERVLDEPMSVPVPDHLRLSAARRRRAAEWFRHDDVFRDRVAAVILDGMSRSEAERAIADIRAEASATPTIPCAATARIPRTAWSDSKPTGSRARLSSTWTRRSAAWTRARWAARLSSVRQRICSPRTATPVRSERRCTAACL